MATFPSDSVRTKNWITETLTDADLEGQLDLLHDYIKAALNSSTGHNHDGTSNQSQKLAYSALDADFANGFTTVTGASGDYLLLTDVSDSNNTKKALASDYIFVPSASNALAGSVVQVVNTQSGAVATGTTVMPYDDTIPQNTEGDEYMTLAITPTSATNKLKIDVVFNGGNSSSASMMSVALFQDSTAGALAAVGDQYLTGSKASVISFTHYMTSGTTSATTFKVRAGSDQAGTTTFNGNGQSAGTRTFGGVAVSSITITEIKV